VNQVDAESHPIADVANAAAVVSLVERDGDDAGRKRVSTSVPVDATRVNDEKKKIVSVIRTKVKVQARWGAWANAELSTSANLTTQNMHNASLGIK